MRISDWSSDVCSSDLFELVVHDDLLSLFLVSARASRRISTPPLMAMMAVAKPPRRSGQLVPSHSTSTPANRMPPLDMKSLKLKVVAARRLPSGCLSRRSSRRQRSLTPPAIADRTLRTKEQE